MRGANESDVICENTDLRDTYLLLVNRYYMPPNVAREVIKECVEIGERKAGAPIQNLEFPGADSCTGPDQPVYADHPQLIESKT